MWAKSLDQKTFYHATKHKNVKSLLENKFDEGLINSASRARGSGNVFNKSSDANSGDGFYIAKDKQTASNYGGALLEVKLKPESKILDIEPYWLKKNAPEMPMLKDYPDWYVNHMKEYWEKSGKRQSDPEHYQTVMNHFNEPDFKRELFDEINPKGKPRLMGGKFDNREFLKHMRLYAKENNYDGINVDSVDTVLFNNHSIESIKKIKKSP